MAKKAVEEKIEDVVIEDKTVEPYGPDDLVEIPPLFYDKDKYSAPVCVIVNGYPTYIQRGVSGLKVRRVVAEVLQQSAYQTQMAGEYMKSIEGVKNLGEI